MAYDNKPYEHKDGAGTLFQNANQTNPRSPKLKGSFKTPSGELLEIALWTATNPSDGTPKIDKNGNKYYDIKVSAPFVKEKKEDEWSKAMPAGTKEFKEETMTEDSELPF